MAKFKTIFHRKSESLPSAGTAQKDDDADPNGISRASTQLSSEIHSPRTHRSSNFKNYITSFKSRRFLSLHPGRTERPQPNNATTTSAFSAGKIAGTPIASLFTPRPVSISIGRSGSSQRQMRRHRQYSINLTHVPIPEQKRFDPSSATAGEIDTSDVELGSPTESQFIDRGSPLDTVRLARRRSKASRYSTGHSPLLAPPHPLSASPLASSKTSYPPAEDGTCEHEPLIGTGPDRSCSSLWSPPAYRTRSTSRATEDESFNTDMRPVGPPLRSQSADSDKTAFHRVAEILQQATARMLADPAFSQSSIFRSLAPFAVFFSLLALATTIPRYYTSEGYFISDLPPILALAIVGVGLTLTVLRSSIWVIDILAKSFCEADLAEVFRKRGMEDANGMRMAEGDIVAALF